MIEVRSISAPTIGDSSNAGFTIAMAQSSDRITLIYPNGGETLIRGTTIEIAWSSTGNVGTSVKIVARNGTNSGIITGSTPNDGSYLWKIPATYPLGPGMSIEITSTSNLSMTDTCDGSFTLASP